MSKIKRLPDAELEIMNALWDADAPLTAVRQNRGPALTSGFALNKRQFKQRLAALWDTAP